MSDGRPQTARLAWMDLLRGLAVIGMVETHVVNTVLAARFDNEPWLAKLMSWDGLIAPMFLWIAGYAQGLAVGRAHAAGKPVLNAARLRRLGLIGVLAYALHIPWALWARGDFGAESWRIFLQADILQCMAVSLLAIACIAHLSPRRHVMVLAALAVGSIFAAPAAMHWETGLMPLDAFLNRAHGSLFPVFPWFGFAACGFLATRWQTDARARQVIAVVVGATMVLAAPHFAPSPWFSQHPSFFFERLGWLMVIAVAAQLIAPWLAPRWIMLASRESLLLYVLHLQILYALPVHGQPFNVWIGRTQSMPATALIFVAVLVASMLGAWLNEERKLRQSAARLTRSPASA